MTWPLSKVAQSSQEDKLVELLDDVSAALETVLAHYGNQMPAGDLKSRTKLCQTARELCDAKLRPEQPEIG